jgi:alanyl-tRNA synthetase
MQATERLYFTDSSLLKFQAQILQIENGADTNKVLLDRTAFYPTGGGQPFDTGKLGDMDVLDVVEEDGGRIFHIVNKTEALSVGQTIEASIDKNRRLDHLQQHSGQHILSQAFIQACKAETHSFHMGAQTSTIDIELPAPTDEAMRRAEEVANAIIFDNRPMRVHLLDEAGAALLPLRKEIGLTGTIRIIEIEGFDWSPCGGTHAKQTGQVGLIVIKSFERVKSNLTRVEFVCGHRALEDYRLANQTAVTTARLFSVGREGAPEMVAKSIQENKSLRKRMRELLELAIQAEAAQLVSDAPLTGDYKVIKAIFDTRDAEEIRLLATKIVQQEPAIALLATKDANSAKLVFARSANLSHNMGQWLSQACQLLGGRGGGKPEMAQGGGSDVTKLEEALQIAAAKA